MDSPVFFDASGRRRRWVGRGLLGLIGLIFLTAAVFATTLVEIPTPSPLQLPGERYQPLPFRAQVAGILHRSKKAIAVISSKQGPKPGAVARGLALPQRVGFYLPDEPDSAQSLRRNWSEIDWLVPAIGAVTGPQHKLSVLRDAALEGTLKISAHRPKVTMLVQNQVAGEFDTVSATALFSDPRGADVFLGQLADAVVRRQEQGVVFDFEDLPADSLVGYRHFLEQARRLFQARQLEVSATVPASDPAWDLTAVAKPLNYLFLMNYDEHWLSSTAGPIASQDWFDQQLTITLAKVPADKVIVALGAYGYDWHDGKAEAMTVEEAWTSAHDSGALPTFDHVSGNTGFAFDEDGVQHTVWFLDAAANWNQLRSVGRRAAGVALWRLGSEDPGFWEVQRQWYASLKGKQVVTPDIGHLSAESLADVEGDGEVLSIDSQPTTGSRNIVWAKDGRLVDETYVQMPTPFVVRRSGARPKLIALTFDDGPDAVWTPQILDVLEREHAPATFFIIGENAVAHPQILRRIVADGNELGNHSFTHPNLAEVSNFGTRLELNSTQRLIQAYTGRGTRLFRAPYFGDAEPTTADELIPAWIAKSLGYSIVGLHVDPGDWRTPGTQAIVDNTMASVHLAKPGNSRNIVLLHDGGGNRAQTLAALPQIIQRLRAEGYTLVPVSALVGLPESQIMPEISGADLLAVRADVGIFLLLGGFSYVLKWIFFFAIALGISRVVFLTGIAVFDRVESPPPSTTGERVSIIIPAFNEAQVIAASVERVLASDYPDIEVIVADDGSSDATSAIVREQFGSDPRVRLLTLMNGGKARALNTALECATGKVIIALDADTQFMPDTVSRLVAWFADPLIGAVAGNAVVGNRVNLCTRWQAVEYVTAQNIERRALDALGAITVVPGAVGAWRREALDQVGGYPTDTLAEDQDLTIAIQRRGWRVAYDVKAIALTEAPETFGGLARQRFRWSFGTLQCLWKHRAILRTGRPRGLAWIGLPQAWLFQIVFAAISPIIDLALVLSVVDTFIRVGQHGWDQTQSDVLRMGIYWAVFVSFDLLAGWVAYWLDGRPRSFPALLMLAQRFVYRQLMYGIVLRSVAAALRGQIVGWGKLDRTGRVSVSDERAPA